MEAQYLGRPVVIHLSDVATSIDLDDVATQVFNPMMRDVHEELMRHGLTFCLPLYLQHQQDVRRVDFRYALLAGLLPDRLDDAKSCSHIRRAFQAVQRDAMSQLESKLNTMTVEDRAEAQGVLTERRATLAAKGNDYPLTEHEFAAFVREALRDRIWQWLDDDIAAGRLTVTAVRGNEAVLIDDLVRWAAGRKVVVEQPALPGCEPLVAASYHRLHQHLSQTATYARVAPVDAAALPPVVPRAQTHKIKNRLFPLHAEIELAMKKAIDAENPTSVWVTLTEMAEAQAGSLIGFSSDGVQYRGKNYQATGVPDVFKLKNLRDRMGRAKTR